MGQPLARAATLLGGLWGSSLRAGRKGVARGVASLGKGWAIPGETRLALKPFAVRCIRDYHLDGVLVAERRGRNPQFRSWVLVPSP